MNTVLGFACAMGVDMGYNSTHHEDVSKKVAVHVHADGKKHQHDNGPEKTHHTKPVVTHQDKKDASKKEDCCTGEVLQFQQLDKSLIVKAGMDMPVWMAIITTYFGIDIFKAVPSSSTKYIANYFHPPPTHIRISIHRFQV